MKLSYLDAGQRHRPRPLWPRGGPGLERLRRQPDVALDEYHYTYDRAGNRTSRDNESNHDLDEAIFTMTSIG